MKSSSLIARKLGNTTSVIVAAPAYLERFGQPDTIKALEKHNRLSFCYTRAIEGWPLLVNGTVTTIPASGRVQAGDGEALRQLALAGVGLARLATFMVREDIQAGRLIAVLEDCNPGDLEEFHAVYIGQGGPLPARVRALLDFLVETVRMA
jgi:DNA-binding transcriptional LysR family regulator